MPESDDDSTIANSDQLFRRVPPWNVIYDNNVKRKRPSSAAFENDVDGMSVSLESVLRERGLTPDFVLRGHEQFALAAITAEITRAHNQIIRRDPIPAGDEIYVENPAHALVIGEKKKSVQRAFAKAAIWIVQPPANIAPPTTSA